MAEIGEVLFDVNTITAKVMELARFISEDYAGKELLLVCVLKGAAIFTPVETQGEVARGLTLRLALETIGCRFVEA